MFRFLSISTKLNRSKIHTHLFLVPYVDIEPTKLRIKLRTKKRILDLCFFNKLCKTNLSVYWSV